MLKNVNAGFKLFYSKGLKISVCLDNNFKNILSGKNLGRGNYPLTPTTIPTGIKASYQFVYLRLTVLLFCIEF